MNNGTKMKRGNAVRKPEAHEPSSPFCAAHPDLSSHRSSPLSGEETSVSFRSRSIDGTLRAHVRADHVMVTKKK
jgi:hypothetical protein